MSLEQKAKGFPPASSTMANTANSMVCVLPESFLCAWVYVVNNVHLHIWGIPVMG